VDVRLDVRGRTCCDRRAAPRGGRWQRSRWWRR
jgi:hypothetical protein